MHHTDTHCFEHMRALYLPVSQNILNYKSIYILQCTKGCIYIQILSHKMAHFDFLDSNRDSYADGTEGRDSPNMYLGDDDSTHARWPSAMEEAVGNSDAEMVKLLLESGADANEIDSYGEYYLCNVAMQSMENDLWGVTPITATWSGIEIAELLLQYGADVTKTRSGMSALQWAVYTHNVPLVRTLLNCHRVDFLQLTDHGLTTVSCAARGRLCWPSCLSLTAALQLEIVTMLEAEPERRVKERNVALAMGLHPRLGVESRLMDLDAELIRMVLDSQ
jgi:hypothetical protein